MQRASVDLPQPVSPTRPSVSPWRTSSDTPSTAVQHRPVARPGARRGPGTPCATSTRLRSGTLACRTSRAVTSARLDGRVLAVRSLLRSAGSQHADWCCGSPSDAGAAAAPRRGTGRTRSGQRGANGQPGGRLIRLGGVPGIGVSRLAPPARPAASAAGPRCRGGGGGRRCSRRGACSITAPAYITTTSSAISATTPRSWVIRMIAVPNSRCSRRITSSTCACTVTSSAVVGSSAISSAGLSAIAIAIITRWRIPPENWCG